MQIFKSLITLHSRWFGTYEIEDPRPIAANAPYTYFVPSEHVISEVQPGDLVKAIFRPIPGNREWDAERMWITVLSVDSEELTGSLDNEPLDFPQLRHRATVRVPRTHVIDVMWGDGHIGPEQPSYREYWERCLVDACVVDGRSHVDYLYRETPDMGSDGDKYPDSGWRIRGTEGAIAEDERLEKTAEYIALGAVLNRNDSWLSLIDEATGNAFQWNDDLQGFVKTSRD